MTPERLLAAWWPRDLWVGEGIAAARPSSLAASGSERLYAADGPRQE